MSRKEQQEYLTRLESENRELRLQREELISFLEEQVAYYKAGPGPYNAPELYERYDAKEDAFDEVLYRVTHPE